jgi:hypothetical protein
MEIVFMMTGNLFHKFQKEGQILKYSSMTTKVE